MSIQDTIIKRLCDNGLSPDEAKAVMTLVITDPVNKPMEGRWDESPEGYPPTILALAWNAARYSAVQWIDANKPMHWARPMFAS